MVVAICYHHISGGEMTNMYECISAHDDVFYSDVDFAMRNLVPIDHVIDCINYNIIPQSYRLRVSVYGQNQDVSVIQLYSNGVGELFVLRINNMTDDIKSRLKKTQDIFNTLKPIMSESMPSYDVSEKVNEYMNRMDLSEYPDMYDPLYVFIFCLFYGRNMNFVFHVLGNSVPRGQHYDIPPMLLEQASRNFKYDMQQEKIKKATKKKNLVMHPAPVTTMLLSIFHDYLNLYDILQNNYDAEFHKFALFNITQYNIPEWNDHMGSSQILHHKNSHRTARLYSELSKNDKNYKYMVSPETTSAFSIPFSTAREFVEKTYDNHTRTYFTSTSRQYDPIFIDEIYNIVSDNGETNDWFDVSYIYRTYFNIANKDQLKYVFERFLVMSDDKANNIFSKVDLFGNYSFRQGRTTITAYGIDTSTEKSDKFFSDRLNTTYGEKTRDRILSLSLVYSFNKKLENKYCPSTSSKDMVIASIMSHLRYDVINNVYRYVAVYDTADIIIFLRDAETRFPGVVLESYNTLLKLTKHESVDMFGNTLMHILEDGSPANKKVALAYCNYIPCDESLRAKIALDTM